MPEPILTPPSPEHIHPLFTESEPPQRNRWNINGWPFFIAFSSGALLFWLLELAYQYYVLIPGDMESTLVRGSALAGTTLISAALFSSAIFKWFPQTAKNWRVRRYLGVSGHVFIVMHTSSVLFLLFDANYRALFYTFNPVENPIIFGAIAYVILWVMALTSFDWAMKKIGPRRWKFIHRFVYIAYPALILHFIFMNPALLNNLAGYLLIGMTALAVFGQLFWFFKTIARRKFKTRGTVIGFAIIIAFIILLILGIQY